MTDDFKQEFARRQIWEFQKRCDHPATIGLARHAALPVALNCELLHVLRVNFFLDESLPFSAETDVLFSSLVEEIGEDLYEIRPDVRDALLGELHTLHGPERIREIAGLLWRYTRERFAWADRVGLERAQQLTAVHYLDPDTARKWLEQAETGAAKADKAPKEWFVAMRREFDRLKEIEPKTDTGRRRYWLRNTPETVSDDDFKSVFGLNADRKPLAYVENDYKDNEDGTITDHATGLMWQKSGSADWLDFELAMAYIKNLNREEFAGHNDWRLPSVDELLSLMTEKKLSNNLFIDTVFDDEQWLCRSSDRRTSSSEWIVYFDDGNVYWGYLKYYSYVRVVRAGKRYGGITSIGMVSNVLE